MKSLRKIYKTHVYLKKKIYVAVKIIKPYKNHFKTNNYQYKIKRKLYLQGKNAQQQYKCAASQTSVGTFKMKIR